MRYYKIMAYDESLATRLRAFLGHEAGFTEKKMFGGLAFLVNGHMAIAASGHGGLLVRVDPGESDELLATTSAQLMEMRGRTIPGWLRLPSKDVASDDELARWVELSVKYTSSLPPKQ